MGGGRPGTVVVVRGMGNIKVPRSGDVLTHQGLSKELRQMLTLDETLGFEFFNSTGKELTCDKDVAMCIFGSPWVRGGCQMSATVVRMPVEVC
jgi:hypothetical protein